MFLAGVNQILRRHLDAQVDDLIAVVGQDDVHQIFADVVDIPLDRRQEDLALAGRRRPFHIRLQMGHGELHRLRRLQHLGHNQLIGVELAAYFVHSGHQRPVNHCQRLPPLQGFLQILGQSLFAALDNRQSQPLVQRQTAPLLGGGLGHLVPEMGGKGGYRVIAAMPDQVFRQFPFFGRNGGVALHHFRVDDRQIQPGLNAMVEKNRVEHFPPGRRQAKGYIGNAQDGFSVGQGCLNQPHPLNGFGGRTDIVGVAGAGRKNQGVKNQILLRDAVLFGKQGVGAEGDFHLALAGDGLGLVLVVVNAAHYQRRAVSPGQGGDGLETGFPILQVHRVDDGLPLQPFQRLPNDPGVRGIQHNGGFDLFRQQVQKGGDVGQFIPVGVLQAYIEDMGAVANLAAADFGGFLKTAAPNQAAETAAAQHIGALPHNHRAGILVDHQGLNAGYPGFRALHRRPRGRAGHLPGQQADVFRAGAAAAAYHIKPAGFDEPAHGIRQHFRGFVILAILIRQAGVGQASHRKAGQAGQGADVVGHKLRAGGAVKAQPQQIPVG